MFQLHKLDCQIHDLVESADLADQKESCRPMIASTVINFLEQEAEANAEQVASNTGKFVCNHAMSSVGSLSVLLWTLSFIVLSLSQLLN